MNSGLFKALNMLMVSSDAIKWPWPGHASVAEAVFKQLSDDLKKNLDIKKMKDGSNDPDEKFKDTRNHSYPNSYKKAIEWLGKGKKQYDQKNYEDASYSFGVATHYISDTFAAPHCVSKESSKDHHNYEIVADDITPNINYVSGDLDTMMKNGVEIGKKDWKNWIKTKDKSIVQQGVDRGASVAYSAIKDTLK